MHIKDLSASKRTADVGARIRAESKQLRISTVGTYILSPEFRFDACISAYKSALIESRASQST